MFTRIKLPSIATFCAAVVILSSAIATGALLTSSTNIFEWFDASDETDQLTTSSDLADDRGRAGTSTLGSRDGWTQGDETEEDSSGRWASNDSERSGTNGASSSHRNDRPGLNSAAAKRIQSLVIITRELRRRQRRSAHGGSQGHDAFEEPDAGRDDPEYSTIRAYLTDVDESPADVRTVNDILTDPSNIVSDDSTVNLLAWDVRYEEPRGSYLYVLQQNGNSKISQIHRYFCHERRLDILAESCQPVASIYSDDGVPVAVGYTDDGQPVSREADDLDRSLFSSSNAYIEANEFLLRLQQYLDSLRT